MQTISSSQASAEVPINENFQSLGHTEVFAKKQSTTAGLTWGYWGGRWGGVAVADGTLTLTASSANYLVVARATSILSASTSNTNWNDVTNYARVYLLTTGASAVTALEDHRVGVNGVHGYAASVAAVDELVNPQTGTSYTYAAGDKSKLVSHSNAANIAATLPTAGGAFTNGWWVDVQNRGVGTLVITPTTSTIDGTGSVSLTTGQGCRIISDGANYWTQRGAAPQGTGAVLGVVNVFTKNQSVSANTLTSGATVSVDASASNNFKLVLGTNATLANPTSLTDGMVLNFCLKQDATGGRTLAYGSKYKWPGGVLPVLSTSPNAVDMMGCYYDSAADLLFCNMLKGFA